MNKRALLAERARLVELRDNGIPAGIVRVIVAEAWHDGHDQTLLNFGAEEPVVAELARAIIDKRIALIDAILRGEEMPPRPIP